MSAASAGGGTTVTVNVTGADGVPLASAAVQVTVVAPSAKNEPEAGSHVTAGAASKLSVAVTSKSTTAPGRWRLLSPPAPAGTSMSSTGATTGAVQSATKPAALSPVFRSASRAVTVTVCGPSTGGTNWKLGPPQSTAAPSTAQVKVPGSLSATVAVTVWSA